MDGRTLFNLCSNFFDGLAPQFCNGLGGTKIAKAFKSRLDHVMRIVGTEAFGENITNTGSLEHSPYRSTSNHTGTGGCGFEQDLAGAIGANNFVGNGYIGERHGPHVLARLLHPFADGLGHLIGFTETISDLTIAIPNHDDGAETEAPTTFDDLGDPVDEYYLFDQFLGSLSFGTFIIRQGIPPYS